jgi:DNA-binding transcriptional regulator YhcF (GntR family)
MPTRPTTSAPAIEFPDLDPKSPYEHLAVALRDQIIDGTFQPGLPLPPLKQIGTDHNASAGTAQRAVKLLADWGLVELNPGRRTIVNYAASTPVSSYPTSVESVTHTGEPATASLDLEVRQLGTTIAKFRADGDPTSNPDLRNLHVGAIRRRGGDLTDIGDYELVVQLAGSSEPFATFVATS